MKKLLSRFPCCTTAAVGGADEYSDSSTTGDSSSPSATPSSTTTLQSTLSLQTLPSVPSLQSFSLLDTTTITLSLSHSSSLSLSSSITCIALHGSSLYATSGHQINVYDHTTLAHLDTFNSDGASAGAVKSVAFADGKVLTAHQDGRIRVWKHHVQKYGQKHEQQQHVQNNHNHNHKLVSTLPTVKDRLLRFPFPNSHVQVRRHKRRLWVEHHDAVSGLTVSRNNNSNGNVYSISWDKTLKVWAPKKGFKCLESVTAHDDAINAVTVNSDGTVYTGSADGRIGVWGELGSENNKKRHARVATLEKHKSAVNALALSTDGSILFSGACDRSILVWEREDSAKYMVVSGALRGHDGAILCLINVADFLISGSADRTVRIWRRGVEGKYCCLKVLVGHLKPVKSLAAKMEEEVDELTVFSGALDGEIKVWKIKVNYNL